MPEWDELFKEERYRWQEPDEVVENLAQELRQAATQHGVDAAQVRILDLGFGAGRHVVYLAHMGLQVCGTDISPRGLELACAWLQREGLQADLRLSDMAVIPFPDAYFDAIISTYVIHHNTLGNIRHCVAEMRRTLVPGGQAIVIVQSKRGYRYGVGQRLEPDTFILDEGADAGVPHHFFDPTGLHDLFSAWGTMDLTERTHVDAEGHLHAHWVVKARKGQA